MWNVLGKLPLRGIKTFSELSFRFLEIISWTHYFLDTDIADKCDAAELLQELQINCVLLVF